MRGPSLAHTQGQPYSVYVRDQDRRLRFYLDQLGFHLVVDTRIAGEIRWIAVVPSDGSAVLALIKPPTDCESYKVGRDTGVTLVTEDIAAKFQEWSERGVRFHQPPTPMPWGIHTSFEDIDGNQFSLIQSPWLVEILTAERRAAEERREAERRAAYEMDIARQVQARLFPQRLPPLKTLEYAGACVQARHVGGDYYDFLDLGPGHLALVVGDVAGKSIAGALLMANLQANLRSRLRQALEGLPQLLKSVNRLLYENTAENTYATLFFAEYQDKTQRLRYVNCGHYPGLLLRRDQALERLESTCTVLGAFDRWECATAECGLRRATLWCLIQTESPKQSATAGESSAKRGSSRCCAPIATFQFLGCWREFSRAYRSLAAVNKKTTSLWWSHALIPSANDNLESNRPDVASAAPAVLRSLPKRRSGPRTGLRGSQGLHFYE